MKNVTTSVGIETTQRVIVVAMLMDDEEDEPYRDCRRAHSLRGWTHGTTQQVLP